MRETTQGILRYCGQGNPTLTICKPRPVEQLHEEFPETGDLDWPERTRTGLLKSLAYHGSIYRIERTRPSEAIVEQAVKQAQSEIERGFERSPYSKHVECISTHIATAGLPGVFASLSREEDLLRDLDLATTMIENGERSFDVLPAIVLAVDDAIDDSDPDSTPGIPLNYYNSKKSAWCEDRMPIILLVIDRLRVMLNYCDNPTTGVDLVDAGVCDPIYTFIKDEPHKRVKLDKNRFRIISGVSLVDNLIERVLFSKLNKFEIMLNEHIPYKPGMGLHDEGQKSLHSWFTKLQRLFQLCSTDVSGWDWSITDYLLDADLKYRAGFTNGNACWLKLATVRYLCLKWKVFQLPSGDMFTQDIPCILPSGSYLTSSTNSHMRYILSRIAHIMLGNYAFSDFAEGCQMGDDALERYHPGLLEIYTKLGFTVKGVEIMEDGKFSFCSTLWDQSEFGFPESWAKTLFRFLHKKPNDVLYPTYREQFLRDLRHHPRVASLVERVDQFRRSYAES